MRLLLSDRRADALVAGAWRHLLLGLALAAVASRAEGLGVLSAFASIWLGACAASLRSWRTERGVWMLSGLFLLIALAVYTPLQIDAAANAFRHRRAPAWVALDSSVGTALLLLQARLLLTVTIRNRQLIGPGDDA